ncbi:MAG: hypothetical protein ACKVX7_17585 [Planctomycetota bacterium]
MKFAYGLFLASFGLLQSPTVAPPANPVLRFEQVVTGATQKVDEAVEQQLFMTKDRLRLNDPSANRYFILRLDREKPLVYEVAADSKHYTLGKEHEQIQRRRDVREQDQLRQALAESDAVRDRILRDNYLIVEAGQLVRKVTVEEQSAEDYLGHKTRRYLVSENGRLIVDALVATDLPVSIPFFDFYRRVGAFSNEVLEALRKIPGVPLQAKIKVVGEVVTRPLEVRATSIAELPPQDDLFEIPPGCVELKESPFAPCAVCGEQVERASGYSHYVPALNAKVYFDTKEHYDTWFKQRRDALKREPKEPKEPK